MPVASAHAPVPATESVVHVPAAEGRPAFDLAYERRGSGEPVVLLHGIGHHWQAWEPVLTLLAASHEVIALDLPGMGASPGLPPGLSYDREGIRPALTAALSALGLERPHVVGNSLGGLLALDLGLHGRAASVTAFSPAGFWTEPERIYASSVLRGMHAAASGMPEGLVARLARSAAGRTALTSTIYAHPGRRSPEAVVAETAALRDAEGFAATLAASRRPDTLFTSDVPDVPVTIGWGDRDRLLLRRQGVRAKKTIPGARLVRLRGCGHVPMNDNPALVARVVLDTARVA
ncbi:alpha/beta fold hydrolase [Streptomyces armeniacus]|uniref:Alpha/beta fold hydrolase n=1 Tax=Streptomyces armeniacus TaxID=83291 RepID=A0A345XQ63_9ACTN|nr:alpha/beta fold hydrolase [Streptomyces armeniacus]AXK33779.1 alpha/beta fold hydrolase [Streptomyces armeniacus]